MLTQTGFHIVTDCDASMRMDALASQKGVFVPITRIFALEKTKTNTTKAGC